MKVSIVEIEDMVEACPYCEQPKRNKRVCCGETHFEPAFVLKDGTIVLESQMEANNKAANEAS